MNATQLQKKAKRKQLETEHFQSDPRFLKTIGKLVQEKLVDAPHIPPYRGMVTLEDALWAAQYEYRILELLPAIILKRPKLFLQTTALPEDLTTVILALRKGKAVHPFRDVPARQYEKWVHWVGRKNKLPTLLKTFRFSSADQESWEKLKERTHKQDIELIREAIQLLLAKERISG